MHRYRSQAYRSASQNRIPTLDKTGLPATPPVTTTSTLTQQKSLPTEAGGLNTNHGRGGPPSRPAATPLTRDGILDEKHEQQDGGGDLLLDGARDHGSVVEESTHNTVADSTSQATPPPAPAPDTKEAGSGDSSIKSTEGEDNKKPRIPTRMKNGCLRFGKHLKDAIFRSWINVLLVAVPVGIAVEAAGLNPSVIFAVNAVAIIPLAGLLTHATESVAARVGDSWGALLNISFGNAVELIIFIIALAKDEITIVQASLLGSILANLLLILGMAFFLGGLRFREQIYNNTVTQMSACLLTLSVMSLLLPTAFHASFNDASANQANTKVLEVSRGTSIILLFIYGLYLLFQLKSHAYMYESTPQNVIDEESHPGVLADIMNSSSSSDSSSSSSSDSDSDGSGSVATTSRRVKRMFKNRRRRKSSAGSTTSSNRTGPGRSMLSSPSTQEKDDYFDQNATSHPTSRRPSALAHPNGEDADADNEDNGVSRVFDWATKRNASHDGSKSPDAKEPKKKNHKKHSKKHRKYRKEEAKDDPEKATAVENEKAVPEVDGQPKVNFADDVQVVASTETTANQSPRMAFNMRNLSSRAPFRPAMTKMLSNNVFAQPPPNATPGTRPVGLARHSTGQLRRTNSLPDRLNRQNTPTVAQAASNSDPVPPYQRQRYPLHKVTPKPTPVATAEDGDDEEPEMSKTAAIVLLLISTGLVAACAEFLVDAIPGMVGDGSGVSQAFIGLIILPIVGNAAEHVTAVTVATKNKMDLAIGVAVGSSIQIALFVTPVVVLLGWILNTNMSLYFNLFETVSLFVTVFVVNFLVLDGRSNYMEGALLMAAYVIIAVVAFYYPADADQSSVGGGAGDGG